LQHSSKWKVRGMKQTIVHWVILDSAQIWRCSSHHGASLCPVWVHPSS
jgi:hypothetical protein